MASSSKFWKLAKWGKTKANTTPDLPLVPDLETQEELAKTFEEKTKAFSEQFFPDALVPEPTPANCETDGVTIVVQTVWLQEERGLSLCRPVAGMIGSAVGPKR